MRKLAVNTLKYLKGHGNFLATTWVNLLIFTLFFPTRKIFFSDTANIFGFFSDFTAISLYSSTIVVYLGFFCFYFGGFIKLPKQNIKLYFLAILITSLSCFFSSGQSWMITYFYLATAVTGIVLHGTISGVYNLININKTLVFFTFCIVFQFFLAIIQFSFQSSLGLYLFGESPISLTITNVAKLSSETGSFIRSYGLFPHPNALSGVLMVALPILILLSTYVKKSVLLIGLYIVSGGTIIGLLLTFSRAGLLASALSTLFFLAFVYFKQRQFFKKVLISCLFLLTISSITILILGDLTLPRATLSDPAVTERGFLNSIGLKIIKNNPMLGVGPGNSILEMENYASRFLEQWEHQPIHNYFLITTADIGAIGLIVFIILIFRPFYLIIRSKQINRPFDYLNLKVIMYSSILFGFFVLMLFDHYFYTLEQNRLIMWLFSGLAMGEILYQRSLSDTPKFSEKV